MKKVYKAHILFTKEKDRFEVFENGYIAVENGIVLGVANNLKDLGCEGAEVTDFGDKLLIPAMNDMHVHAPQVHNQGVAMDLELLPWLQNYTFPEESKYADVHYAERMYRRFLHTQWLFGTMRSVVFGTMHTDSTRVLMKLYQEAGMGAFVGKVAMNRNCPDALIEDVKAAVEGNQMLIAEFNKRHGTNWSGNLNDLNADLASLLMGEADMWQKINELIKSIERDGPMKGIGKPEKMIWQRAGRHQKHRTGCPALRKY